LLASFGDPVYAQFLEQIKDADPEQLERLTHMLDQAEARKNNP